MRRFGSAELAERMSAEDRTDGAVVSGFATDSRQVQAGELYIAIKGERVDGHDFSAQAFAQGAAAALVERTVDGPHLLVPDVVEALARFGRSLRDKFIGPVIGLTGSAGKTTTKEMLAGALSSLGDVVRTPGNRNTEYTSPLLWAEVTPDTRAIVVEMAMRGFGQIAHLARISKPTIGVITNVGYSHLLQVGDREGIARAKGELLEALPPDGICVLPADDAYLPQLREIAGGRPMLTFGFAEGADCRVLRYHAESLGAAHIEGVCQDEPWTLDLPAAGRHLATNAAAAILAASIVGVSPQVAANGIERAELPPMRMERRERGGATVLLDAYNAAPNSVLAAIETIVETPVAGRRLAVLGEMRELGEATVEAHRSVGAAAREMDDVIFVGETAGLMREAAGRGRVGDLDAAREMVARLEPGDVMLVKGSRALGLERALD